MNNLFPCDTIERRYFMKIKKLQLKDYKRFHDLTIDLGENTKRIVALVVPNGCGKSSVFDGLLFINPIYTDRIGGTDKKDYKYHSLNEDKGYDSKKISVVFKEGSYEKIREDLKISGKLNTLFSFRSAFRYNSEVLIKEEKSVTDIKDNKVGASTSSGIDERMTDNYRRLRSHYNKYLNEKDVRPTEAKAHILGELNKSIKNCIELELSDLGDVTDNKGTLFFKKEDTSREFSFNVLSAGEKEVIDILLDLYLKKDVFTDTIFLIDEPELHLNTAIQRKLLVEINKLIGENCQLWVATHSIGFLRAMQEELKDDTQIIRFDEKNQWATQAYTLRPSDVSRSEWANLFHTALDDLSALVCPRKIIYCEGRDEPTAGGFERGFDARVYNTIFSRKYPDTLFVSSGGNTELDQRSEIAVAILSKALPNLSVHVLKDRDMASGRDVSAEARAIYLENNPSSHHILKRWELENYIFDKEILLKYCETKKLTFNEEKFHNCVSDIVNDHVKEQVGVIKSCCGIETNVNPEKFKLNLSEFITEETEVFKQLESEIFQDD